jgi:hypothetical protein
LTLENPRRVNRCSSYYNREEYHCNLMPLRFWSLFIPITT